MAGLGCALQCSAGPRLCHEGSGPDTSSSQSVPRCVGQPGEHLSIILEPSVFVV